MIVPPGSSEAPPDVSDIVGQAGPLNRRRALAPRKGLPITNELAGPKLRV